MNDKDCKDCKENKPFTEFYKYKNGRTYSRCKSCQLFFQSKNMTLEKRLQKSIYDKTYRNEKTISIKAYKAKWYKENLYSIKEKRMINKKEEYRKKNEYAKKKRKIDPCFVLACNLRISISGFFKGKGKTGSAIKDLGCSIEFLKSYLESKFYLHPVTGEQMNWKNKGLYGWHVDHVLPLISFDLTNRDEFLKACHYTNLQPLWAIDNLKKGDRF